MEQEIDTHAEQKIMERLKKLPPRQLDEVLQFIDSIAELEDGKAVLSGIDDIKRSIKDLRGRGKGGHLVEKLLRSRQEDKKFDEQ